MPSGERPHLTRHDPLVPLSPERIERRSFAIEARGYNRDEVRAYLFEVAAALRLALRATGPVSGIAAAPPAPRDDDRAAAELQDALERAGAEAAKVLRAAQVTAAARHREADAVAAAIIAQAHTDAAALRQRAGEDIRREREQARMVLTAAREEAEILVGEARERAEAIVAGARDGARRREARVAARADDLAGRLAAAQAAVLDAAAAVDRELADAIGDLRTATDPPVAPVPAPPPGTGGPAEDTELVRRAIAHAVAGAHPAPDRR